jgi:hypothetical protein
MASSNKVRRETLNEFIRFKKSRRHYFKFDYLVSKYIDYRKSISKKKPQTTNSLNESRVLINKIFKMYHDLNNHKNIYYNFHDNTAISNNINNDDDKTIIYSSHVQLSLFQKRNFISYPKKDFLSNSSEVS